jgi:hypothetical protein
MIVAQFPPKVVMDDSFVEKDEDDDSDTTMDLLQVWYSGLFHCAGLRL